MRALEGQTQVVHTVQLSSGGSNSVLLATARVLVRDGVGFMSEARVLLDQGANTFLISKALVRRLRLPRRFSTMRIVDIGSKTISKGEVTLSIAVW